MDKLKKKKIAAVLLTIITIGFIYLVKTLDVEAIGPNNSSVGFAKLNEIVRDFIGSNMTIYKITEILGLLVLGIVGIYGILGVYQLIKRKSLFKVDKEIILLGVFYVAVLLVYVLFEKVVINYRPVIIDGELEASFPSSHTVLALCVGFSSVIVSKKYLNNKNYKLATKITILLCSLVLIGRIASGVHWISDILGGLLISETLLMYFVIAYKTINKE